MADTTNIFVGDLASTCEELHLQHLFQEQGFRVLEIKLMRGKHTLTTLNYGFVRVDSVEEACRAIHIFHGMMFHGRRLRVNWGGQNIKSNKDSNESVNSIYVKFHVAQNLSFESLVNEEVLRNIFGQFGTIKDVSIRSTKPQQSLANNIGYGFVHFLDGSDGLLAVRNSIRQIKVTPVIGDVHYTCEPSKLLVKNSQMSYRVPNMDSSPDPQSINDYFRSNQTVQKQHLHAVATDLLEYQQGQGHLPGRSSHGPKQGHFVGGLHGYSVQQGQYSGGPTRQGGYSTHSNMNINQQQSQMQGYGSHVAVQAQVSNEYQGYGLQHEQISGVTPRQGFGTQYSNVNHGPPTYGTNPNNMNGYDSNSEGYVIKSSSAGSSPQGYIVQHGIANSIKSGPSMPSYQRVSGSRVGVGSDPAPNGTQHSAGRFGGVELSNEGNYPSTANTSSESDESIYKCGDMKQSQGYGSSNDRGSSNNLQLRGQSNGYTTDNTSVKTTGISNRERNALYDHQVSNEEELGEMPIVSTRSNNSITMSPYSSSLPGSGGESFEESYLQSGNFRSSGSSQQRLSDGSSNRDQPAFAVKIDVSEILSNIKLEHNSTNSNVSNQPRADRAHFYPS